MTTEKTIVTTIKTLNGGEDEDGKRPYLIFLSGPQQGNTYLIEKKQTFVGRSSEADMQIEDSSVSRKHFQLIREGKTVIVEDLASTNGTYINGERVTQRVLCDNDQIQISTAVVMKFSFQDKAENLFHKELYKMAVVDPVTNIYNKRYFLDRISEEFSFASRRSRNLSLMLMDIDHFKIFNDTYGHLAGDMVLQKVAGTISTMIRHDDIFARYGGEEFVLLMRDTTLEDAIKLAERIRERVATFPIVYEQKALTVTLSLGVTCLGDNDFRSYVNLIEEADKYLYQSKAKGRNRVSYPAPAA